MAKQAFVRILIALSMHLEYNDSVVSMNMTMTFDNEIVLFIYLFYTHNKYNVL